MNTDVKIQLELTIDKGRGYVPAEENKSNNLPTGAILAQYGRDGGEAFARNLLRDPGVLRELSVGLPPHAVLDDPPPPGLVARNQVVLAGTYTRGVPTVRVRGKLGKTHQSLQPRPEKLTPPPAALIASVRPAGPAKAVSESFAVPPWNGRKHQRSAKLGITWAGRGRFEDRGHLDEKIFRRYLGTRVFPRARACYNQALGRQPDPRRPRAVRVRGRQGRGHARDHGHHRPERARPRLRKKTHIKKGDMVKVLAGEDRSKEGRVLEVDGVKMRAIVEGLNINKKHSKPSTANLQGGIVDKEGPIHISNLMLIDAKTGKPGRVGRKANKEGVLERYVKTKKSAAK